MGGDGFLQAVENIGKVAMRDVGGDAGGVLAIAEQAFRQPENAFGGKIEIGHGHKVFKQFAHFKLLLGKQFFVIHARPCVPAVFGKGALDVLRFRLPWTA